MNAITVNPGTACPSWCNNSAPAECEWELDSDGTSLIRTHFGVFLGEPSGDPRAVFDEMTVTIASAESVTGTERTIEPSRIDVDSHTERLTSAQARELAGLLVQAADVLDNAENEQDDTPRS